MLDICVKYENMGGYMMRVKKVISVIVSIFMLVASISLFICDDTRAAEELLYEDFTYRVLDDETVEITKYNGSSFEKELAIPEEINGKRVTRIGAHSFEMCKSIERVKLPSSVTSIGYQAFYFCDNLKVIEIPTSVTSIVYGAFLGSFGNRVLICGETDSYAHVYADYNNIRFIDGDVFCYEDYVYRELRDGTVEIVIYAGSEKEVVIPAKLGGKKVTGIREQALRYCKDMTSVKISLGVTNIGEKAFLGCANLARIEIASSVTNIGHRAFCNCDSLVDVKIPFGVTDIGDQVFLFCNGLKRIEIAASVTNIGWNAFSCNNLTSIVVDEASQTYCSVDGILYNKDKTILLACPAGKTGNVIIPEGVTVIKDCAFDECSLTGVQIPSITYIENIGFRSWRNVDFTIHGAEGSYAQKYANEKNIKFTTERIPDEPKPETPVPAPKVGDKFSDTKSKGQYKITGAQTVSYIKTTAVSGKVTIPATVTYKGKNFKVTAIYKGAFKNKTGITAVIFGSNIATVGSEAFSGCRKLKTVSLNKGLTKLGNKAFYNCKSLTQVKIGSNVKTIGTSAFTGCTSLKKVTLGTGLTTIGNGAFSKCTALTAITIPKNVKKIGKQAFYGCKRLKSITIKTTKLKSSSIGSNAFKGIYSKAVIDVPNSKKAAYKKLFKAKGAGKNVKYK